MRSGSPSFSLALTSDKGKRQILPHVPEFYTIIFYNQSASYSHYSFKCNGLPVKSVNVFDKCSLFQAVCSFLGNCREDLHYFSYTLQSSTVVSFCSRLGKNKYTSEKDVIADPEQDLN